MSAASLPHKVSGGSKYCTRHHTDEKHDAPLTYILPSPCTVVEDGVLWWTLRLATTPELWPPLQADAAIHTVQIPVWWDDVKPKIAGHTLFKSLLSDFLPKAKHVVGLGVASLLPSQSAATRIYIRTHLKPGHSIRKVVLRTDPYVFEGAGCITVHTVWQDLLLMLPESFPDGTHLTLHVFTKGDRIDSILQSMVALTALKSLQSLRLECNSGLSTESMSQFIDVATKSSATELLLNHRLGDCSTAVWPLIARMIIGKPNLTALHFTVQQSSDFDGASEREWHGLTEADYSLLSAAISLAPNLTAVTLPSPKRYWSSKLTDLMLTNKTIKELKTCFEPSSDEGSAHKRHKTEPSSSSAAAAAAAASATAAAPTAASAKPQQK